jgi:hypothetical protein
MPPAQARSKYDRICKDTSEEADRMLLRAIKQSQKIRMESSEEAERILSLKDGWHIVMERDRDELTGHELMGFKGEISGFDDKGRVRGPVSAAVLHYCEPVHVNCAPALT